METNNSKEKEKFLSPRVKHTAKTMAVVQNSLDAGKLTPDLANHLLNLGNDDISLHTIFEAVRASKIDPKKLEGTMPDALLKHVNESWDDIENKASIPVKMATFKERAPEVYKAKFFEKNGRLPAERDGKPL